jgi:hypothetical protein
MPTLSVSDGVSAARRSMEIPWLDYASTAMPDSHELILWWAMYLWLTNGTLRSAFSRVAEHFITEVQFPDLDSGEESAFKDLFTKHLNYRRELKTLADEYLCYGNVFVSMYLPFKRTLICKQCRFEQPIKHADYEVSLDGKVRWLRTRPCKQCGDRGEFEMRDRKDADISRICINRYSPFEIKLAMNPFSQRKDIYWKIPHQKRRDMQSKAPIFIEDTPIAVLEAVAIGGDLKFDEEAIFHLDETIISGMDTRGWGVPRTISNFRTAWLQQTTNRADQAIAMDYTLGLRLISPQGVAGAEDPMINAGAEDFVMNMQRIINRHRASPADYATMPAPVNYQFCGGEGENLLPADKLKFRQQELLSECGVPLEYHQMSLTVQAAPMALQLFESAWQAIPSLYNTILSWIVKVSARNFGHDETAVVMKRTTIAYDESRKQILAQLMAANQISPETALAPFGVDAAQEVEKVLKHQDLVAKKTQEHQEKQQDQQEMAAVSQIAGAPTPSSIVQQQQQGGGGGMQGGGGMPTGGQPGGGQPTSLQGMSDQAQSVAQQLVSMPELDRKQQLRSIRESNPDLHALVMSNMTKLRAAAASQGQQQLLQPPTGGGGTAAPQ